MTIKEKLAEIDKRISFVTSLNPPYGNDDDDDIVFLRNLAEAYRNVAIKKQPSVHNEERWIDEEAEVELKKIEGKK